MRMNDSDAPKIITAGTTTVVLKILRCAAAPLTMEDIRRELPGLFKVRAKELEHILDEQLRQNTIYRWRIGKSTRCFWTRAPHLFIRTKILEILSDRPRSRSELDEALQNELFGCSMYMIRKMRREILKRLFDEKTVFEYPPVGSAKASLLGATPPNPMVYLKKVEDVFRAMYRKLEKAGISYHEAFQCLHKLLATEKADADRLPKLSADVMDHIVAVEPRAGKMAPVSIPMLRSSMDLPKDVFDEVIWELFYQEKIYLHRHAHPSRLDESEREKLIKDDNGNYYVGIVLRKSYAQSVSK